MPIVRTCQCSPVSNKLREFDSHKLQPLFFIKINFCNASSILFWYWLINACKHKHISWRNWTISSSARFSFWYTYLSAVRWSHPWPSMCKVILTDNFSKWLQRQVLSYHTNTNNHFRPSFLLNISVNFTSMLIKNNAQISWYHEEDVHHI